MRFVKNLLIRNKVVTVSVAVLAFIVEVGCFSLNSITSLNVGPARLKEHVATIRPLAVVAKDAPPIQTFDGNAHLLADPLQNPALSGPVQVEVGTFSQR